MRDVNIYPHNYVGLPLLPSYFAGRVVTSFRQSINIRHVYVHYNLSSYELLFVTCMMRKNVIF